jgi:hypothetical protein
MKRFEKMKVEDLVRPHRWAGKSDVELDAELLHAMQYMPQKKRKKMAAMLAQKVWDDAARKAASARAEGGDGGGGGGGGGGEKREKMSAKLAAQLPDLYAQTQFASARALAQYAEGEIQAKERAARRAQAMEITWCQEELARCQEELARCREESAKKDEDIKLLEANADGLLNGNWEKYYALKKKKRVGGSFRKRRKKRTKRRRRKRRRKTRK